MIHELKTLPKYFKPVSDQRKTFEVRKNDRNFQVGDVLILREWDRVRFYTGKAIAREITYILANKDYCKKNYVILAVQPTEHPIDELDEVQVHENSEASRR